MIFYFVFIHEPRVCFLIFDDNSETQDVWRFYEHLWFDLSKAGGDGIDFTPHEDSALGVTIYMSEVLRNSLLQNEGLAVGTMTLRIVSSL